MAGRSGENLEMGISRAGQMAGEEGREQEISCAGMRKSWTAKGRV
jgi:hypothetical protein